MDRLMNRKLLVSVFDASEAREAMLGGGRIIDSEDPRSALGNIKPRQIQEISTAVLDSRRGLDIQLSTNIGEDQNLYHRTEDGRATLKSTYEISGKAAQAALGVAAAMGTAVHPANIVKVGVDAMPLDAVRATLAEIVLSLRRNAAHRQAQVMAVFFAQDLGVWESRRTTPKVRRELIATREFHTAASEGADPLDFDLVDFADALIGDDGARLFPAGARPSLTDLQSASVLPPEARGTQIRLNELVPHSAVIPGFSGKRTDRSVIKAFVDTASAAGCTGIMLDTQIQSKVSETGLVDTSGSDLVDLNGFDLRGGLSREGILKLEEIEFLVEYSHYSNLQVNLAGSVTSYQAQQLWLRLPRIDQMATRGSASALSNNPATGSVGADTRQAKVIKRDLVSGLAPPEQGGRLVLPPSFDIGAAQAQLTQAADMLSKMARAQGLPFRGVWVADDHGELTKHS